MLKLMKTGIGDDQVLCLEKNSRSSGGRLLSPLETWYLVHLKYLKTPTLGQSGIKFIDICGIGDQLGEDGNSFVDLTLFYSS